MMKTITWLRSLCLTCVLLQAQSWITTPFCPLRQKRPLFERVLTSTLDDLMPMDVVIFSKSGNNKRQLGAVQEYGKIAPLSSWTTEFAFDECIEFVVDEEDLPGYGDDSILIHSIVSDAFLSYGSRQVGGGKGPGNPHGEESECLYYIDKSVLDDNIEVVVNPRLEITW